MVCWDDAQTKILDGFLNEYCESKETEREAVVISALGQLKQVPLGGLEGMAVDAQMTVRPSYSN